MLLANKKEDAFEQIPEFLKRIKRMIRVCVFTNKMIKNGFDEDFILKQVGEEEQ